MDNRSAGEMFTSTVSIDGRVALVRLAGELDLHGAEQLAAAAQALPLDELDGVAVDAGSLTFIDSAGLHAMLTLRHECEQNGIDMRLTAVSAPLERVMAMAGVEELLRGRD
ncbi:MAG TPA: STAS domain-containing protein [Acidimicrobiales bacterium]|nr:STAS domain-containing protein [Acidimicrobiales bacterium]